MNIEANGATLNVCVDGPEAAPAVLLWHGAGCTLAMWDHVVDALSDRYRLVRFDVRGVGGSSPAADPASQYTFETYAEDACGILDTCGIDMCHVWSMAWGSRAALAFCALHTSRVRSAALFDVSIAAADTEAQRAGSREAQKKRETAGSPQFEHPAGWNVHEHPDSVPAALAAARKFDLRAALPRLTMPILAATGDHDPNLVSSRELVALVPNARLRVFENVGHGSILQRPDLAVDAFLDFQAALLI